MKKTILAIACALALAGCGGMSEEERLSTYVQGYLDLTYKDQINDDFLEIAGISEEEAEQQYQDGLDVEVQFFIDGIATIEYPTEETETAIRDMYEEIYSHSSYTVGAASELDSGNYAVEVKVQPIDIMTNFTPEDFQNVFTQVLAERGVTDNFALYSMSEEEYASADQEYANRLVAMIEEKIPSIGYTEEKSLAVQIMDGGDTWEPNQDDFSQLDTWMIDYSTFGYE